MMNSHEVDYEIIGDAMQIVEVEPASPGAHVIHGRQLRQYALLTSPISNQGLMDGNHL